MELDKLTGSDLEEFLAGYRAAKKGEPFWPHNTEHWLAGFQFRVDEEKQKAEQMACH